MNDKKRLLIAVDILGFDILPRQIASSKGISATDVRKKFIDVINGKINVLTQTMKDLTLSYGERDDWLLATTSPEDMFACLSEILSHDTGWTGCEKIPLEIAVGLAEYDDGALSGGTDLIVKNATINFLKTKLLIYYHNWYKQTHDGKSPTSTFVVIDRSSFDSLEVLDKRLFTKVEYVVGETIFISFSASNLEELEQRGRIPDFLEKIGYPKSKNYGLINQTYVPPIEYEDVLKSLQQDRIVLLTGTLEYGKTYTAVKLLWEYYKRGYKPKWIKGGELFERIEVRRKLVDLGAELQTKTIVYFEDPFGQYEYERRESLENQLDTIIHIVKHTPDSYVIITSREEVFKLFLKEQTSSQDVETINQKLNVIKPSYDFERREKILLNWATVADCKWLLNDSLKKFLLEQLKKVDILPTVLSIKEFASASADILGKDELSQLIKEKSNDTARVFAKEVQKMQDDKIAFLSLPLFSDSIGVDLARELYEITINNLKLESPDSFDNLLMWFKDKVNTKGNNIEFVHPSFSQSFKYLLDTDKRITKIISKILVTLSEKHYDNSDIQPDIIHFVISHFNVLEAEGKQTIFELVNHEESAFSIGSNIIKYYSELPDELKGLVFQLSKNFPKSEGVIAGIAIHFDKIPEELKTLFFQLIQDDANMGLALVFIAGCYDLCSAEMKQLLQKSVEEKKHLDLIGRFIVLSAGKVPLEEYLKLLNKISETEDGIRALAFSLIDSYNNLPSEIQNIVFKLAEDRKATIAITSGIAKNYKVLPENVKQLLFDFGADKSKQNTRFPAALAIIAFYDELPDEIQKLLYEILKDNSVIEDIKSIEVNRNHSFTFEKSTNLPSDIKKLLDIPSVEKLQINEFMENSPDDENNNPMFD